MGEVWNAAAIRDLLTAAFSDQELTALCFDHFRPVYEEFALGLRKGQKVQHLVEYCDRQAQMDKLLMLVRERNLAQYARHEKQLKVQ